MADGTPDDGPSLEMPSLSLRRKKAAPDEDATTTHEAAPTVSLGGLPAAALTGLVVGGLAVLLAWLAGAGCSAARGTSSCGGAAGLPILLAALVVLAYAGALLLRLFGVADAGSTSLLAVGVLAVLVMVFLLGSLDEWWTAVAVPTASLGAYVGSWWVTAIAVGGDEPPGARTPYDVR
jgi:uncharacterized membrane protein YfcA